MANGCNTHPHGSPLESKQELSSGNLPTVNRTDMVGSRCDATVTQNTLLYSTGMDGIDDTNDNDNDHRNG